MERYTLIINQTKNEDEAMKHLRSSSLVENIYRQTFLAVLNLTLNDEKPEETMILDKDIFYWKNCSPLDTDLNIITVNTWLKLAAAINILADRLPEVGQYYMDVLCCCDVFSEEMPKDKGELCVTLERLELWHNAHIILRKPKCMTFEQMPILEKWALWLNASISNISWPFSNFKLWHGSLSLPMGMTLPGFELLFIGETEDALSNLDSHSTLRKLIFSNEVTHVSTSLDLLADFNLLTIPPYLFSSIKFLLQIPEGRRTYGSCHSFIEFIQNRPGMALAFSLDFTSSGTGETKEKYDFQAWTRSFQTDQFPEEHPQACLPEDSPHLTFVIYWDATHCSPRNSLVAQLLMDPDDLDLRSCLPQLIDTDLLLSVTDDKRCDWESLIPRLDSGLASADTTFKEEYLAFPESIYVDSNDWPERRFLLLRDLKKQKAKRPRPGSKSHSSPRKVMDLKESDFAICFGPSGTSHVKLSGRKNASRHLQILEGGQGKYPIKVEHSLKDVLDSKWPDFQNVHYHDIYLNNGLWTEELEVACSLLKNRYVLEETSSSNPSRHGLRTLRTIPVKSRGSPSSKKNIPKKDRRKNKSPFKQVRKPFRVSPRKFTQTRNVGLPKPKMGMLPSKVKVSANGSRVHPKQGNGKSSKTRESKTSSLPSQTKSVPSQAAATSPEAPDADLPCLKSLRVSPRAKRRISLKKSTFSETSSQKATGLSDKHRMKLREAVAYALESEGICLNSPVFKLCGRRLFNVCKAFVQDILGKGNTSGLMKKIASAHVKQVIEFEKIKS